MKTVVRNRQYKCVICVGLLLATCLDEYGGLSLTAPRPPRPLSVRGAARVRGGAAGRGRAVVGSQTETHAELSPPPPRSTQTHGRAGYALRQEKGEGGGRRRGRPGRNACVGNKQKQSGHLSQGVASPTWFRGLLVHAGLVGGASELSKPLPGRQENDTTAPDCADDVAVLCWSAGSWWLGTASAR